jgi:hypothetical protein
MVMLRTIEFVIRHPWVPAVIIFWVLPVVIMILLSRAFAIDETQRAGVDGQAGTVRQPTPPAVRCVSSAAIKARAVTP